MKIHINNIKIFIVKLLSVLLGLCLICEIYAIPITLYINNKSFDLIDEKKFLMYDFLAISATVVLGKLLYKTTKNKIK